MSLHCRGWRCSCRWHGKHRPGQPLSQLPGKDPSSALDAFLDPLKEAVSCIGGGSFSLSPKARAGGNQVHSWTLNSGNGIALGSGRRLKASMHFQYVDSGQQSPKRERFRVTTVAYMYALELDSRGELITAHWHPSSKVSDYKDPHYHLGSVALSDTGVFLERAHIPSGRVSLEKFVRTMIEQFDIAPTCADWRDRLDRTEAAFRQHSSW